MKRKSNRIQKGIPQVAHRRPTDLVTYVRIKLGLSNTPDPYQKKVIYTHHIESGWLTQANGPIRSTKYKE